MSNDHVPEPFRSLLNDLTSSHRAAHEELREGMAALNRVNRNGATMSEPTEATKIVIERSPWPNTEPQYLWTAYFDGREDDLSEAGHTPEEALARLLLAVAARNEQ